MLIKHMYKLSIGMICCLVLCCVIGLSAGAVSDYSADCMIQVKNELSGRIASGSDETFKFTIAAKGDAPLPNDTNLTIIGTNEGYFGPIRYTQPGVYEYTVSAIEGNNRDISYDTSVYHVVVVASNVNGNPDEGLAASVAVVENVSVGAKTDDGLVYKGVCHYTSSNTPGTGDSSNAGLYVILLSISLLGFFVIAIIRNKRRKES